MDVFSSQLRARRRTAGAEPLLTYYDLISAERTELSAITFGNWVDKTANLLTDECALAPGDVVELDLALDHPGHWVTLVWAAALWQLEAIVAMPGSTSVRAAEPVLQVVGPERAQEPLGPVDRMACRLHPLGLGFTGALPDGVIDYATEVRGQGDRFVGADPKPEALAWVDEHSERSQRQLADRADSSGGDDGRQRRLVLPGRPWSTVRDAVVRPVLTGGSSVVVRGGSQDEQQRIAVTERASGLSFRGTGLPR